MAFHSWVSRARGPPSDEPIIAAIHLLGSSSGLAVLAAARTEEEEQPPPSRAVQPDVNCGLRGFYLCAKHLSLSCSWAAPCTALSCLQAGVWTPRGFDSLTLGPSAPAGPLHTPLCPQAPAKHHALSPSSSRVWLCRPLRLIPSSISAM